MLLDAFLVRKAQTSSHLDLIVSLYVLIYHFSFSHGQRLLDFISEEFSEVLQKRVLEKLFLSLDAVATDEDNKILIKVHTK